MDIFLRPDGTFGFEEFRRDAEDGRGWFAVGYHSGQVFGTEAAALGEAEAKISWLRDPAPPGSK